MQVVRCRRLADRTEYFREYYKNTKAVKKKNYNAQKQYVGWIELKKALFKLKKKIGSVNYDLILDELEKLDRIKHG